MIGCNTTKSEIWLQENKLTISRSVQAVEIEDLTFVSSNGLKRSGYVRIIPRGNLLLKRSTFWEAGLIVYSAMNATMVDITITGTHDRAIELSTDNLQIIKSEFVNNKCDFSSHRSILFDINVRRVLYIDGSIISGIIEPCGLYLFLERQ